MTELDHDTPVAQIQTLLKGLNWISDETLKETVIPGEGNMNVVMRVITDQRSFILKQSRPYVNKYPTLEAPIGRINTEYQFYRSLHHDNREIMVPQILAYSPEHHLLMMNDLGHGQDLNLLYGERKISNKQISSLVKTISQIHTCAVRTVYPDNLKLRRLNHQHIFELPFLENNDFELDEVQPGLQALSSDYKANDELKSVIREMGLLYMEVGSTLLHGDYYPGSWMQVGDKLYVIDPEFSFAGPAEFDLGVMLAHLIMITSNPNSLSLMMQHYTHEVDALLINRFAGVEIMRRIIGLAQLPVNRDLSEKAELLEIAKRLITC